MEAEKIQESPFCALYERYAKLKNRVSGLQAELRRAASPEDLTEIPSFYRLMTGRGIHPGWQRVAFFLPYVGHQADAASLGAQLAKAGVREMRLFQVLRSEEPNDLVQLRRLVQQIKPSVDWQRFGATLYYWNTANKRRLLEDYFLALNSST